MYEPDEIGTKDLVYKSNLPLSPLLICLPPTNNLFKNGSLQKFNGAREIEFNI